MLAPNCWLSFYKEWVQCSIEKYYYYVYGPLCFSFSDINNWVKY
jgi:hypothetical protein